MLLAGMLETRAAQAYCRSNFRRYFEGLGAAEARVSPVERFVFSLLLSRSKADAQAVRPSESRDHKQT
jgi:hypothetical protein